MGRLHNCFELCLAIHDVVVCGSDKRSLGEGVTTRDPLGAQIQHDLVADKFGFGIGRYLERYEFAAAKGVLRSLKYARSVCDDLPVLVVDPD